MGKPDRLTAALQATAPKKGPDCSVATAMNTFDPDEQTVIAAWLADAKLQHAHLSRTFKELGHEVSSQTVSRHRRGECSCVA